MNYRVILGCCLVVAAMVAGCATVTTTAPDGTETTVRKPAVTINQTIAILEAVSALHEKHNAE